MNQDEIFRKLTRGVKFDRIKYREDAVNLGLIPKPTPKIEEKHKDPKVGIYISELDSTKEAEIKVLDTFDNVNTQILKNLKDTLQWKEPTRIQMAAIPTLLGMFDSNKILFFLPITRHKLVNSNIDKP